MSRDDWQILWRHMRPAVFSFIALLALLSVNVTLGATLPFTWAYIVEGVVLACMVLAVLLVSMEVLHEPPLMRLFAGLGFFWVAILFTMTLVDYLSR